MEEKLYAVQIKEALDFVKESKDAIRSVETKKMTELSNFKKSQLKSKGKFVLNHKSWNIFISDVTELLPDSSLSSW